MEAFELWSYETISELSPRIQISEVFCKCIFLLPHSHPTPLLKLPPDSPCSKNQYWSSKCTSSFCWCLNRMKSTSVQVLRPPQFPTLVAFWHFPSSPGALSRQRCPVSTVCVAMLNSNISSAYLGFTMALLWFLLVLAPLAFSLLGERSSCTCTENSHYQWLLTCRFAWS